MKPSCPGWEQGDGGHQGGERERVVWDWQQPFCLSTTLPSSTCKFPCSIMCFFFLSYSCCLLGRRRVPGKKRWAANAGEAKTFHTGNSQQTHTERFNLNNKKKTKCWLLVSGISKKINLNEFYCHELLHLIWIFTILLPFISPHWTLEWLLPTFGSTFELNFTPHPFSHLINFHTSPIPPLQLFSSPGLLLHRPERSGSLPKPPPGAEPQERKRNSSGNLKSAAMSRDSFWKRKERHRWD